MRHHWARPSAICAATSRAAVKTKQNIPIEARMKTIGTRLMKRKVGEIFIAAESTRGQPGGARPTGSPLKVRPLPSAISRATEIYKAVSGPEAHRPFWRKRYMASRMARRTAQYFQSWRVGTKAAGKGAVPTGSGWLLSRARVISLGVV